MTATALLLLVPLAAPPAEATIDDATVAGWVADIRSADSNKRRLAIDSLIKAGPKAKSAVPALIKMIDPKSGFGYEAVDILAAIGSDAKEAVPTLLELLPKNPGSGYHLEGVARALAKIDGPKLEVTRALLLSSGKCTPIYLTISSTLHEYTAQVVGHLVTLCADKDAKVREKAATVIATLTQKDNGKNPQPSLYEKAGDATKALPAALEKLLADESAEVRVAGAKAITHVAPELADKAVNVLVSFAIEMANTKKGDLFHAQEAFKPVPEKAAKALLPLLGHESDTVRNWALSHLVYLPVRESVEEVLKNGKTARAREAAAITLGARYSDGAPSVPALKAALADGDFLVRFAAARSLVQVGRGNTDANAAAVPVLVEGLRQKDQQVRVEATQNLLMAGAPAKAAIPALKKLLDDEKPEVRLEAALALVGIDKSEAAGTVPVLIEALKAGDSPATRAAQALVGFGPTAKDAVPELVKHFEAKNVHLRLRAAEAAARIDPAQAPKAVEVFVGLLKDKKHGKGMIRSYALVALQRIGPAAKDALPALAELLTDDGPFHADVARAMIAIDPDGAKPAFEWVRAVLSGKNNDEDDYDLLERLPELGAKAKPLVPELVKLLQSKTPFHRENAALTLAAIGPDAKEALPALKQLAEKDPRKDVREAAAEAVKKIEAK